VPRQKHRRRLSPGHRAAIAGASYTCRSAVATGKLRYARRVIGRGVAV